MTPYFQHGNITIYHGDARELIHLGAIAHASILDPPYVLATKGGGLSAKRAYHGEIKSAKIDEGFDFNLLRKLGGWMCFCSKAQLLRLIMLSSSRAGYKWMPLFWGKTNPTPLTNNVYLPDCEYIIHSYASGRLFGEYKDKSRFYISKQEREFSHPTVKPVSLMMKLVSLSTQPGEIVFDPFLGTGSTLVAAKLLGRGGIGIEREEKWCEVAAQRLSQEALL